MRSPPFHTGPKRPLRSRYYYYYNYYKRRIKQRPLRSRYYKRRIKQRSRWTKNVAQPGLDKDKNQDHRQWMRKSQTAPKFELRQVQKRCVRNPSTGARNVLFETVMHGLAKDAVLSCSTQRAKVASCFPYASPSGKAEGSADFMGSLSNELRKPMQNHGEQRETKNTQRSLANSCPLPGTQHDKTAFTLTKPNQTTTAIVTQKPKKYCRTMLSPALLSSARLHDFDRFWTQPVNYRETMDATCIARASKPTFLSLPLPGCMNIPLS